jgi:hypothetical protein
MGNYINKQVSVDIPEGSQLMEDRIGKERMKEEKQVLNTNNGEPIYGSLCCKERERFDAIQMRKHIQLVLEKRHKQDTCCNCLYGRCICKKRSRSYSDVSV